MRITDRKEDHLEIVLSGKAGASRDAGFGAVAFEHCALPELALESIDLSRTFLGKRLSLPFMISSMTGGPARAEAINASLAEAAGALGIALGVGSQRVALEQAADAGLTPAVRARAGAHTLLLANLGAAQLRRPDALDLARRAVDMIEADALIVHLNPLQEALQPEGDHDWRGVEAAIGDLCARLAAPVVVKEVGAGISGPVARRLADAGVAAIDVAGAGGTSWAAVEGLRSPGGGEAGETFRGWGVPTARAVRQAHAAAPDTPLIASGGVRTGLDAAKAIRLGAEIVGQAAGVLSAALISPQAVVDHFERLAAELRIACFCTGSGDLSALRRARLLEEGDAA